MSCKWCPMGQCSMCWEPGASALLWSSPTSSWFHWEGFSTVHSPTHPPGLPLLLLPKWLILHSAIWRGQGVGVGMFRTDRARSGAGSPDTSEDLHNIKLQSQNTLTGQMRDCERKGKKAFPEFLTRNPVFSVCTLYSWTCMVEKVTNSDCMVPKSVLLLFIFCSCL